MKEKWTRVETTVAPKTERLLKIINTRRRVLNTTTRESKRETLRYVIELGCNAAQDEFKKES